MKPGNHKRKFIIIGVVALLVAGIVGFVLAAKGSAPGNNIDSYAECVAAGNPVMESYPEQCRANGRTFVNPDAKVSAPPTEDGATTDTIASVNNAFTVGIPRGWGPVIRAADIDALLMTGETQPTADTSKPVVVLTSNSYGSDGPIIFSIGVYQVVDTNLPSGTKSDITIGQGNTTVTGARYAYTYPEDVDQEVGSRKGGDKDYVYLFTLPDGRYLRASYHVYASDTRDRVDQFDDIVRSLKLQS